MIVDIMPHAAYIAVMLGDIRIILLLRPDLRLQQPVLRPQLTAARGRHQGVDQTDVRQYLQHEYRQQRKRSRAPVAQLNYEQREYEERKPGELPAWLKDEIELEGHAG